MSNYEQAYELFKLKNIPENYLISTNVNLIYWCGVMCNIVCYGRFFIPLQIFQHKLAVNIYYLFCKIQDRLD